MKKNMLFLCLLVVFYGCAFTTISTVKNPTIESIAYRRILVWVSSQDLETRRIAEQEFVDDFREAGIVAVSALDVIPPIREYSDSEFNQILEDNSIEGVLVVILTNAYSDESYIPPSSQTESSASIYGNTIYGTSRTTTSGGYYISKPRVRFEVNLYDIETGEVAWKATTFTRGNAFANTRTLMGSLSSEVVNEYERDATW